MLIARPIMIPGEGGFTPRLKKTIGLFQATIFGIGLILGAGFYSIIGEAAGIAGNIVWISFVIAGLLALIIGLSYAVMQVFCIFFLKVLQNTCL